ncbi:lipoyl(octanoyl) transferase LipB [bacterium]|nr:lipoyl(octanoyl) transferase LipB [bacterium]
MVERKFFGKTDYQQSLDLQQKAVQKATRSPARIQIQGYEFDTVITLGRSASALEEVYEPALNGHPIVQVERGGKATLHSPGQLVIYPICNIKFYDKRVKSWVRFLLKTTLNTIRSVSPQKSFSFSEERAGVYSENAKVASIGLRIDQGVSLFGLAVNLKNDPELFKLIRPCGVPGQEIQSLNYQNSLEDFFALWSGKFEEDFKIPEAW